MEGSKTTSKTSSLKALILKAWRERWNEIQWGINIKTILPRGVSGDVYNLADCILQQATVGYGANQLMISYLKHSLASHLVSYAAVMQRIAKFDAFHKPHCVLTLLDFLERFLDCIASRGKLEETVLASAVASIVLWLLQVYNYCLTKYPSNNPLQNQDLIEKSTFLLTAVLNSDYLCSMFYLAKLDDPESYLDITKKCQEISTLMMMNTQFKPPVNIHDTIQKICNLDINKIAPYTEKSNHPSICLQAFLAIDVLSNPSAEVSSYVNQLLLIQRLKGYSNAKMYCEMIKSSFIDLNDSSASTSKESIWAAFTFLKLPHIIHQFYLTTSSQNNEEDYCADLVEGFEMLLHSTTLLDVLDSKCSCNSITSLLESLMKYSLIKEQHLTYFKQKRCPVEHNLTKLEPVGIQGSLPGFINRAEPTLTGVLKSLSADALKAQDTAMYAMLCQILTPTNLGTILTVACVDRKLKLFTSKLIKLNESSLQMPTDGNVNMQTKTGVFDVTFLILCAIVQEYGTDVVLEEGSDSFFEKWVKDCMVEKNNPKSPDQILAKCDQAKVDILLHHLSNPDDFKSSHLKCHDLCLNIPGAMKEILFAWEQGSLQAADVKRMLETLKLRMFSLAICAAAWLAAYIDVVHKDALIKPLNMLQQLLTPFNEGEVTQIDNFKERSNLMFQIVRKMQLDVYPPTVATRPIKTVIPGVLSKDPMAEQLRLIWKDVQVRGWLHIDSTYILEDILKTAGPLWFVSNMIDELLKYRYNDDLQRGIDLTFSIFHLDIEKCTIALLLQVLPQYLYNKELSKEIVEPLCSVLAKISVYCIYAALENCNSNRGALSLRKRKYDEMEDIEAVCPTNKVRRLNDNTAESCTLFANSLPQIGNQVSLKEPLQSALESLFKAFEQLVGRDGEITPQANFIFQFLEFLIKCGGNRSPEILQKLPPDLVPTLIRALPEKFSTRIILRLNDLSMSTGRKIAARDLCLLRNMQLRPE